MPSVYTKRKSARKLPDSLSAKIRDSVEALLQEGDHSATVAEVVEMITGQDRSFRKLYSALNKSFPEYNMASIYEQHLRFRVRNYLSGCRDEAGERVFIGLKRNEDDPEVRYYVRRDCNVVMLENGAQDRMIHARNGVEGVLMLIQEADYLESNNLDSLADLSDEEYASVIGLLRQQAREMSSNNLVGVSQNKRIAAPVEKIG